MDLGQELTLISDIHMGVKILDEDEVFQRAISAFQSEELQRVLGEVAKQERTRDFFAVFNDTYLQIHFTPFFSKPTWSFTVGRTSMQEKTDQKQFFERLAPALKKEFESKHIRIEFTPMVDPHQSRLLIRLKW